MSSRLFAHLAITQVLMQLSRLIRVKPSARDNAKGVYFAREIYLRFSYLKAVLDKQNLDSGLTFHSHLHHPATAC